VITRSELTTYLQSLLACDDFNDYAPNGLQVEGREHIHVICTAVTASVAAIQQAAKLQADALLVHHGYFWRGENPVITGIKHARISQLLQDNLNLFAYHLPLDCHIELGNNACIGKLLELHTASTHRAGNTRGLLWSSSFAISKTADEMSTLLTQKFGHEPLHIAGSDKSIKNVAWCSGAAQDFIEEAHGLGMDAYISGEVSERTYYQAKELGLHYFACGHHATERYGIQAVGTHLADNFNLQHHFIDSDNPI